MRSVLYTTRASVGSSKRDSHPSRTDPCKSRARKSDKTALRMSALVELLPVLRVRKTQARLS
eukprot:3706785-Prorocentrum_lima.AAC.1